MIDERNMSAPADVLAELRLGSRQRVNRTPAMRRLISALFGKKPRELHAKPPAPTAGAKPADSLGQYRAVSIAPGPTCCKAATDVSSKRYLLDDVPRLPLADCTMQPNCSCSFRKHADRRSGLDRRLIGPVEAILSFVGIERRKRSGRRSTDKC